MSQTESMNTNEQEASHPTPQSEEHEHEQCSCMKPYKEPQFCCDIPAEDVVCTSSEDSPEISEGDTQDKDDIQEKGKDKKPNPHLDAFVNELDKHTDAHTKLQMTLDFMEHSLSQTGTPHFKSFWDARNICLELFKESISPNVRGVQWAKYSELSKEARRLKALFDEQSAFAAEQIEIAIKALEDDIENFSDNLAKISSPGLENQSQILKDKNAFYQNIQNQLNLLNTQAARINALRKELIRTEMRVRQKNKFFQRLSTAGDHVFPKRKDLIKEISDSFINDVNDFITSYFTQEINEDLFFLREEIKALQGIAKVLTLNTHSFTHTRLKLSECWDKIKGVEKEKKKERAQQKASFKQNVDLVLEKISAFSQNFALGELSLADANKKIEEITAFMRSVELGRDEVRYLRDEVTKARQPLTDKMSALENERHAQEAEKARLKRKHFDDTKLEIETLFATSEELDVEKLTAERSLLIEKIQASSFTKTDKNELERLLKPLRDVIVEKTEQALMALSDDDKQSLQQLKELLKQRKARRQESKNQLEIFRKSNGASGFDFEQAMSYNVQLTTEKERLEKINDGIREIEEKISILQKKI